MMKETKETVAWHQSVQKYADLRRFLQQTVDDSREIDMHVTGGIAMHPPSSSSSSSSVLFHFILSLRVLTTCALPPFVTRCVSFSPARGVSLQSLSQPLCCASPLPAVWLSCRGSTQRPGETPQRDRKRHPRECGRDTAESLGEENQARSNKV